MANITEFLAAIENKSADVRFAAWRAAGEEDASVVLPLAKIAGGSDASVVKAALEAMSTLAHSVGKEDRSEKRHEVAEALAEVASSVEYATGVRVHALRLLSLIGGDESVALITRLVVDANLREEAIFCLERIPTELASKAIAASYSSAPDDFKPRVLAALAHRRAPEGVSVSVAAMSSTDRELSVAGLKAYGRIGRKPAKAPALPQPSGLSAWQTVEHMDAQLRWADAQRQEGNSADAIRIYRMALERPEEHWQCAAIVGLAKLGTPETRALIERRKDSPHRNVRITAQKALSGAL